MCSSWRPLQGNHPVHQDQAKDPDGRGVLPNAPLLMKANPGGGPVKGEEDAALPCPSQPFTNGTQSASSFGGDGAAGVCLKA